MGGGHFVRPYFPRSKQMADPSSTVPGPSTPAPADNHHTTTVSDAMSGNYGRPTAGGNTVGGTPLGGSSSAPPGNIMGGYSIPSPAPVSNGGTQVGPDMGHGATIVVNQSGDRPSGGSSPKGGGTVSG